MTPKKVLIINTFGIGDVLFTTPLISNLKKHCPGIFIGYLANKRTATMLKHNPKVDQVFIYERDEFVSVYKESKLNFLKQSMDMFQNLKKEQFDCVLDLSLQGPISFMTWMAGIKQRVGYNYKNRSRFLSHEIELKGYEDKHVVEYYLDLLEILGIPTDEKSLELHIQPEDHQWANELLEKQGVSQQKPLVALIPGGGASWGKDAKYKRWPYKKFAKLADKIIDNFSAAIILMGDKNEQELCAQVAQNMQHKPIQACGETSLGQLGALLSQCQATIVNDGGPLHIAVAAGVKTVSIFGPVDDKVYGPYPPAGHEVIKKDIACRPCYRRFRRAQCDHVSCLNAIEVDEALERVKQVL